jgi:hypothetical protein
MSTARTLLAAFVAILVPLLFTVRADAQTRGKDERCPWCGEDPERMRAAGVVSHGPLPIGDKGGAFLVETLPTSRWVFLETAHLRWASAMGEVSVDQKDRERVEAELSRLRAVLPEVPVKPKRLDPWLRLHLLAMKGEELYARFQQVVRVADADFPAAPDKRKPNAPYMGIGPYLGELDKFEVVLHPSRRNHQTFTESFSGVAVADSFRWHFPGLHKLIVSVPAEDSDLREDRWLWPHVAHNLSHAFYCAFKHFAYDPPVWLDEGLALALEKEIEYESQTLEGEEGGHGDRRGPSDFAAHAARIAGGSKQKTLAQLWTAKDYGELGVDGLVQVWSISRFLLEEHGEAYARFLGGVKAQLDAEGRQSGDDLPGLERRLLQELFGWSPADLDRAWAEWARKR